MNQPLQARGGANIPPILPFLEKQSPAVSAGRLLVPLTSGLNRITEHLPEARPGLQRWWYISAALFGPGGGISGIAIVNFGAKTVDVGVQLDPAEGLIALAPPGQTVDPFGTSTPGIPEGLPIGETILGLVPIRTDDEIVVNVETAGVVEADQLFAIVTFYDAQTPAEIVGFQQLTTSFQTLLSNPEGSGKIISPQVVNSVGLGAYFRNYDSIDHSAEYVLKRADGSLLKLSDTTAFPIPAGFQTAADALIGWAGAVNYPLAEGEEILVRLLEATVDGDVYFASVTEFNNAGEAASGDGGAF